MLADPRHFILPEMAVGHASAGDHNSRIRFTRSFKWNSHWALRFTRYSGWSEFKPYFDTAPCATSSARQRSSQALDLSGSERSRYAG